MPPSNDAPPMIAVDLVDVVEDSWPQKRAWLSREMALDPGPLPRSRAWVESFVRRRLGSDGCEVYEWMGAVISRPVSLARRPLVNGAGEGLRRLRRMGTVRLLSGRREDKRWITEAWLREHELDWLCGEGLVLLDYRPRSDALAGTRPKMEWAVGQGASVLIDNQAVQLHGEAGNERVARILFSQDPDETAECPAGTRVAASWSEVSDHVREVIRPRPSAV